MGKRYTTVLPNKIQHLTITSDPNSPFYESEDYQEMLKKWELPRDLMAGTSRMRDKAKKYLPQHPAETQENYDYRVKRAVLRNYFRRSVETLTGKVFSKPISQGDDIPIRLQEYLKNVDLMGRRLNVFAQAVFKDSLQLGISYILPDFPALGGNLTLFEERQLGARPYLVHIKAEQIIGWRVKEISGQQILTQVRIKEVVKEPKGTFGEEEVTQVRVIGEGYWQIWRQTGQDDYTLMQEGEYSLPQIPLEPVYTNRLGHMKAESPLDDLAWMNLEHYQIRSDQRNALSVASFPLLAVYGVQGDDEDGAVAIGPNKIIQLPDPQSRVEYVESAGAHLEAGRKELEDLEDEMRLFGLQFEVQKPGYETATGKGIDAAQEVSPLKLYATNLQEALENCLKWMDMFMGGDGKNVGTLTVNTDFEISLKDAQEIQALQNARSNGDISRETLLKELKRRGLLPDTFDVTAELARTDTEDPNDLD